MPELEINMDLIKLVLFYVIGGGGSAAFSFWAMTKIKAQKDLGAEGNRYLSIAISAATGIAAFVAAVFLSYLPMPATPQDWLEAVFAAGFIAGGGSQAIHGRAKLRGQ